MQRMIHAIHIIFVVQAFRNALVVENVLDLSYSKHRLPLLLYQVEHRNCRRRYRVIPAVCRPRVDAVLFRKGPCDDAAYLQVAHKHFPCDFAVAVKRRKRHHLYVGGNLKHAVRRGVDDGLFRPLVLLSQLLYDFRSGSRVVSQRFHADSPFVLSDKRIGKPGKGLKGRLRLQACDLPVAGDGILALRRLGKPGKASFGAPGRRYPQDAFNIPKPQRLQVGNVQAAAFLFHSLCNVVQRMRSRIAVTLCIRQRPDAQAVQHDNCNSLHPFHSFARCGFR